MFKFLKNYKVLPVNFNKPWWYLIFQQKFLFLTILAIVTFIQIFWSLLPFIAAKLFETESYYVCIATFITWLITDLTLSYIRVNLNTKFQLQCIHSIYQNAHSYLLTVDPQYHTHRSSGTIIAKIERAARGYEDFADHISFELLPLIVGLLTIITTLAYYSIVLSAVMACFIISILLIGYYIARYRCSLWESKFIKTDDTFKSFALENLTQIQLIRSTFASNYRNNKLIKNINDNMYTESSTWLSYSYLFLLLAIIYNFSLFVLAMSLLWQIKNTTLSVATALGLFLVYTHISKEIVRFGKLLRKTMHSKAAIKDLFDFMPYFGKQNFPVLGEANIKIDQPEEISIQANNIVFDYGKAILFNDHTFQLKCPIDQNSKLYGIIGMSGSGKTSLLSILGGQLKPINGNILINGIDVYKVNDNVRNRLITLQGQVASNIRGTVKSNLLLGLPENHNYSDENLLDILEEVGLLNILNQHNGLHTMLGESGLNISGGQRQRLNFASLYLRAIYYKPLLVLIDEPTSSLDEISEFAITNMIEQLAKNSVTLVVAHRLKTIERAVGIIDLSLLQQDKNITIYTPSELLEHSEYYKELIQGKIQLD
ncbi:MAG: ABC transporter ATP-binding protein [Candidatus Babeliales bacterium]|nr:ABC transporter ATP-binding protein [Candidatus Babeliales bacterium]